MRERGGGQPLSVECLIIKLFVLFFPVCPTVCASGDSLASYTLGESKSGTGGRSRRSTSDDSEFLQSHSNSRRVPSWCERKAEKAEQHKNK